MERTRSLWGRISRSEKSAFLSAFICGMLAHLYIYTNMIPNFDGISRVYDEQQMTVSGRWFLHYVSALNGYTQMPMVIGTLAMLFMAVSVGLIVHVLKIENSAWSALLGGLFVVFPAVADTNTYTFTASAYGVAVLLAVLGIWIAEKRKWGFLSGAILLTLSMGIYQAYVTISITLALLLVLEDALQESCPVRETVIKGLKYIAHIMTGTVFYYIILRFFLYKKHLKLLSYQGINSLEEGYPIGEFFSILKKTYAGVWNFFFHIQNGPGNRLVVVFNVLILVLALTLLMGLIFQKKIYKEPVRLMGILAVLLLLPVAVNFTQIMSPHSEPRLLMEMAFVLLYFLPVLLVSQWKVRKQTVSGTVAMGLAMLLLVNSVYYWEYDNVIYTMLNQTHRSTLSFVTNVVSRIEGCEGYQWGMQVYIVGGFPADRYHADTPLYDEVKSVSLLSSSVIPLNKHIYYYMNDWLNVPIEEPSEEEFLAITATEEFQDMPLYPDDGSVRIIGNNVVVKMQTSYTPRSDYEKAYEERR